MFYDQIPMTASIPSGWPMPTSAPKTAALRGAGLGAADGMRSVAARTAPTDVVRDRFVTGDALAPPFPGPTAWSPPLS